MSAVDSSLFARVVVVAPHARVDAAVPADLALAEVIPMLTALVGEDPGGAGGGDVAPWRLSTLGGHQLDSARSLRDSDVVDGQTLRLVRNGPPPPAPVFDDVVTLVAHQAQQHLDERTAVRVAGALTLVVSMLLTTILLPRAVTGALSGLLLMLLAAAVLVAATAVSRRGSAGAVPALTATAGAPAAFGAGVHLISASTGAAGVMLGGAFGAVYCVAAASATRAGLIALAALSTVCAFVGTVGAMVALGGVPAVSAAAGVATCAVLGMSGLPWLAVRVAGLPPLADSEQTDGRAWSGERLARAQAQTRVAWDVLHGTTVGSVLVAAASAGYVGGGTGVAATLFAGCVLAAVALRMRATPHLVPRAAMLAGALGGLAVMVALQLLAGEPIGLGQVVAMLLLALAALMAILPQRVARPNPVTLRAVQLAEALALTMIPPLAGWLTGLFSYVRHW